MANLRIVFPKPGFYIIDVRLQVLLDGFVVYDGSFKSGADVTVPVAAGLHRIESWIHLSAIVRRRHWEVSVGDTPVTVGLAYSRFWGNFKKQLSGA
ncbi:MAG TPA: hypothetical protein VFG83_16210 [Kofleriaceae bacterium]|nr:hypothetical protein [Kofleriaceae bacterium]